MNTSGGEKLQQEKTKSGGNGCSLGRLVSAAALDIDCLGRWTA